MLSPHKAETTRNIRASLVVQTAKNLPAMQETRVQSLGQEDPLEEEMTIHSSYFLPGEVHRQRSLAGYTPWGRKESDTTNDTRNVRKNSQKHSVMHNFNILLSVQST